MNDKVGLFCFVEVYETVEINTWNKEVLDFDQFSA